MRLFIAFDFEELNNYFLGIQKQLKRAVMSFPSSFHITLKFLGEVKDDKVNKIIENLSEIKFEPLSIHFDSIGIFPDEKYARVVWIGIKPEDDIIILEKEIERALPKFKKDFDFKPHITLARVKAVEYKERFIENLHSIKIEPRKVKLDKFHLYKSAFTKDGMVYEKIASFPNQCVPQ